MVEVILFALTVLLLAMQAMAIHGWWRGRSRPPMCLQVSDVSRQGDSIVLSLSRKNGRRLPKAIAGQHVLLSTTVGEQTYQRAYSLAAWRPTFLHYELAIKAQGKVSHHLFKNVSLGNTFEVSQPKGHFTANLIAKKVLLIAGGIGITPMRAMLHYYLSLGRQVTLIYSARHREQLVYHDELQELSLSGQLRYFPILSQPCPLWTGASGRLDSTLLQSYVTTLPDKAYLCAGDSLMSNLRQWLVSIGMAEKDVEFEQYQAKGDGEPGMITLAGATFHYDGKGSLLSWLELQRQPIKADCRNGSCGQCRITLLEGELTQFKSPEMTLSANTYLACCVAPKSNIHIQLAS
ncbi:2Fe-2S iron-sulfur cluster binding domain-containing protein [Shewanella sp. NKUCC01_JLK]|uniref:2Fe-2S iron-sulfur cluster-binding protein n=1 Tax=Shewanella sp. NKUCC01_JLK TaxID=2842123 RepID=UPI001C5AEC88|nr:2Fe-2S iron-sulfur cluster-binding protein [Shewanella sp. NKUCC01_JLK]MBW3517182.1 2Fe-2S iron-sulfur cluster binding domain-containing protein [Shewanella sp. NKUCC01_JLK]